MLAFSGGKDSLVLAHLVRRLGIQMPVFSVVCVLFPEEEADVREGSHYLGIMPYFHKELTPDRMAKVGEKFLPPAKHANTILYAHRHQPAIDRYAKACHHDLVLFGRRRGENTVTSAYYQRKGFPYHSFHPLREWQPDDIWNYIRKHDIWFPRCYRQGAKQLRTWVSFLIDAYSKQPETAIEKLYQRWPPAVEQLASHYSPARDFLRTT